MSSLERLEIAGVPLLLRSPDPDRLAMKVFQHLKHAVDLTTNSLPKQRADLVAMEKDIADWFQQYLFVVRTSVLKRMTNKD